MKRIIILFFVIISHFNNAQVAITEIYYITPDWEDLDCRGCDYTFFDSDQYIKHHQGEFIELYNYSTEDIPLKGWSISDKISSYHFPDNAIIGKGDYVIVAYKLPTNPDYFSSYFPQAVGNESKVFYQDQIILNDEIEEVKLNMGYLRSTNYNSFLLQKTSWNIADNIYTMVGLDSTGAIPISNDHNVYSIQLNSNFTFSELLATPFGGYKPPSLPLDQIPVLHTLMQNNYSVLTWAQNCLDIINNFCPNTIFDVFQTPTINCLSTGKCFHYDSAGNYVDPNCAYTNNSSNPTTNTTDYTDDQLDDFGSKIALSPNPTSGILTASWDGTIIGKIISMQVNSSSGISISTSSIAPTDLSAPINLSGQPSGIYIVRFQLDSSTQYISKNIIKL